MKQSWTSRDVLPSRAALTLRGVATTDEGLVVEAEGHALARCLGCRRRSQARHRHYWRTLKDVPAHGQSVTLRIQVSRWRCRNPRCQTAIFTERLPNVAAPRARHTDGRGVVVHLVGHALGGRARARLLVRPSMVISPDTVVRLVKRGAPPAINDEAIRVVGIDDWAWQKSQHHFGTMFVDLERRRVVDVLAARTADAVAAWLARIPPSASSAAIATPRTRRAVRRGAPHAAQVADRFHLVLNLRGAVQEELGRLCRFS
jgi:transposase